jgi:uncharacterized protein YkwD
MNLTVRFAALPLLAATLALAGCAAETAHVGRIDARFARRVANVRLDPSAAAAMLTAYRKAHGLSAVRLDPALMSLAQRQANADAAADDLSHDLGGAFASRLEGVGVDAPRAAENLGGGYFSTEEAFAGWRESPAHNSNLLMPQATRFGIAIAKNPGSRYGVFWAMEVAAEADREAGGSGLLASPASAPPGWRP